MRGHPWPHPFPWAERHWWEAKLALYLRCPEVYRNLRWAHKHSKAHPTHQVWRDSNAWPRGGTSCFTCGLWPVHRPRGYRGWKPRGYRGWKRLEQVARWSYKGRFLVDDERLALHHDVDEVTALQRELARARWSEFPMLVDPASYAPPAAR